MVNYAPELISPQYDNFYEAAITSLNENSDKQKVPESLLSEDHNLLSLSTLSQALVGLQKQALIYRRDIVLKDYLHPFYEKFTMFGE